MAHQGWSRQAPGAVLLMLAAAGWLLTANRMAGMSTAPGGDLGGIGWFVGMWTAMTAAMMLPVIVPAVTAGVTALHRDRIRGAAAITLFVGGYLIAWTLLGLLGYALVEAVRSLRVGLLGWDHAGRYLAAATVFAAGIYQLTRSKAAWLRACRRAIELGDRDSGTLTGAMRRGLEHGGCCVACCWTLMVALYALGIMSLVWMALITALIAAERLLPRPGISSRTIGILLAVLGATVAIAPRAVPALTVPSSHMTAHGMGSMAMGAQRP